MDTILERLGWDKNATIMRWNCIFWRYKSLKFIHREIILLTKGCKKDTFFYSSWIFFSAINTIQEFPLTHTNNDTMQFQESYALSSDLLLTLHLFLWQVSWNSSLVSRNFLIKQIENNTWSRGDMEFIFECSHRYRTSERSEPVRYRMWTREDKFHISKRPCVILFII